MAKQCFILLLVCFPFIGFSQANEDGTEIKKPTYKAYIGASFGFSIPSGSFADTETDNSTAGFGTNGSAFQLIDAGYLIYKNLNLSAHYLRVSNGLDASALASDLGRNDLAQDIRYSAESGDYELNAGLIGVGFVKETNSISLQMQIMLAYGNVFLPTIDIVQTNTANGDENPIRISSADESGFGFGVGGGFRIHLNEFLDFSTFATFVNFQQEFEQSISDPNQNIDFSGTFNYEVVNVTFGFAYRFMQL